MSGLKTAIGIGHFLLINVSLTLFTYNLAFYVPNFLNKVQMNFSESLRVTSNQIVWSPNGKFCAIALTARLEIRDGLTLQLITTFNCVEYIQSVEWAPDSTLVYTANFKRGIIEIWQPLEPKWRCKIDEGSSGLIKLIWSSDSRHILTTSEFYLRVTIWSLVNKSILYIKHPKDIASHLQFSNDGDYLAVAERDDCKDYLSILETKSWTQIKSFEIATRDMASFSWAPDDSVIAVWESPAEYKLLIYAITGHCLTSYSAYEWALGIRSVSWSPSSQFIAIGSYDQTVRLMNNITWKIIANFEHTNSIDSHSDCTVYREKGKPLTGYPATLAAVQGLPLYVDTNYEEEQSRPISLTTLTNDKQSRPKTGISHVVFSADGRFLATKIENMVHVVWIWSIAKLKLEVLLVHDNPIKDMVWSNKQTCLILCTGGNSVYLWTPIGCLTVAVPNSPTMQLVSLRWHPSGYRVALIGKDSFSICYLNPKQKNLTANDEEKTPTKTFTKLKL